MRGELCLLLLIAPIAWSADLDVGVDYLSGETQVFDLQGNRDAFGLAGLGYSLGVSWANSISMRVSGASRDGSEASSLAVGAVDLDVDQSSRVDSTSFAVTWQLGDYWLGARLRQQDESSRIAGVRRGRADRLLSLDVQESNSSTSISLDAGRDWLLGNWAPSLGLSLAQTDGDLSRVERIDSLNASQVQNFQQSLDGLDLSISASLAYLVSGEGSALWVPSLNLFHRLQLDGQVAGSGSIRTRFDNAGRTQLGEFSFDDPLQAQDETYVDLSLSWIDGPWSASASYSTAVASDAAGSLYLGLGYRF